MSHSPGRINDKRGQTKAPDKQREEKLTSYFDPITFVPARGYALLEVRFIGASSAIHIPEQVHGKQQYGIIRAMGPGKHHFNGSIIEPEWEKGDFVYADIRQSAARIEEGDRKYLLIGTEWIFGKFPTIPQAVIDEFENEAKKGKGPEPSLLITDANSNGNYPPGAP